MKTFLILVLQITLSFSLYAADEILLVSGERLHDSISGGSGTWKAGNRTLNSREVILVRFSQDPPPQSLSSGVFIRGGSLVCGTLSTIVGTDAEITAESLGALKLKSDEIAGAFSPLPSGQAENMPELAHYSSVLSATLGSYGSIFTPGKLCRVRFAGLDEIRGDRIMRLRPQQILLANKDKGVETINRQFVRMIELPVQPLPPPSADDARLGPEVIVRLKAGDLLRGRVVRLNEKELVLHTTFMGEKALDRGMLAALFPAGDRSSGVTWLSAEKPAKSQHTPLFDSDFPARADSTVDRGDMNIGGFVCERGIGVHSRSELEFNLPAEPHRFVTVCGMDSETRGRGEVSSRILADGKEVWNAAIVKPQDGPQFVSLDIGTARKLTLQVDFGPDEDDSGDHFDWGWAAVISK